VKGVDLVLSRLPHAPVLHPVQIIAHGRAERAGDGTGWALGAVPHVLRDALLGRIVRGGKLEAVELAGGLDDAPFVTILEVEGGSITYLMGHRCLALDPGRIDFVPTSFRQFFLCALPQLTESYRLEGPCTELGFIPLACEVQHASPPVVFYLSEALQEGPLGRRVVRAFGEPKGLVEEVLIRCHYLIRSLDSMPYIYNYYYSVV